MKADVPPIVRDARDLPPFDNLTVKKINFVSENNNNNSTNIQPANN